MRSAQLELIKPFWLCWYTGTSCAG